MVRDGPPTTSRRTNLSCVLTKSGGSETTPIQTIVHFAIDSVLVYEILEIDTFEIKRDKQKMNFSQEDENLLEKWITSALGQYNLPNAESITKYTITLLKKETDDPYTQCYHELESMLKPNTEDFLNNLFQVLDGNHDYKFPIMQQLILLCPVRWNLSPFPS